MITYSELKMTGEEVVMTCFKTWDVMILKDLEPSLGDWIQN
jgi:hypothetical protein